MGDIAKSRGAAVKNLSDFYKLDELFDHTTAECSKWIVSKLADNSLYDEGMRVHSFPQEQVNCQLAIIEQNWLIIRQLDLLNQNIEKLLQQ